MKYLSKNDIAVLAMSLPENYDWDKAISQAMLAYGGYCDDDTRKELVDVLNRLQGTIALGVGPSNGLLSFVNPGLNNWEFVLFAQNKDGRVDEWINEYLKIWREFGCYIENNGENEFYITDGGMRVTIKKDGDAIVVSSRSLYPSQGTDINASVFSGKTGEFIAQIPKDNSILSSLGVPFGVQIDASTANDELNIEVKLLDSKELFLAGIIKLVTDKL
jgi:hypothetical protein